MISRRFGLALGTLGIAGAGLGLGLSALSGTASAATAPARSAVTATAAAPATAGRPFLPGGPPGLAAATAPKKGTKPAAGTHRNCPHMGGSSGSGSSKSGSSGSTGS